MSLENRGMLGIPGSRTIPIVNPESPPRMIAVQYHEPASPGSRPSLLSSPHSESHPAHAIWSHTSMSRSLSKVILALSAGALLPFVIRAQEPPPAAKGAEKPAAKPAEKEASKTQAKSETPKAK